MPSPCVRADILGGDAARPHQQRAGGDDQGFVCPGDGFAQGRDGALVDLAVLRELREVMDEGQMGHAVGLRRPALQAVEVLEVAAKHLRPRCGQRFGAGVRARETQHLVAGLDEVLDGDRADEARCSGDENTHYDFSFKAFSTAWR